MRTMMIDDTLYQSTLNMTWLSWLLIYWDIFY